MTATSVFKDVDLHCDTNNAAHRTSEVSVQELIVRRGEPFTMTVTLNEPFKDAAQPLFIQITIGEGYSEERGTMCRLSVPDGVTHSPNAKAVWKVEQDRRSSPYRGVLVLNFTPPADAPIGQFEMMAQYGAEEKLLAKLTVLFNPWCPEDAVFLRDEKQRQEYVMNENGMIYRGSTDYIMGMDWDFGQFEDNMVDICLGILNISSEHLENPADDVSKRADPHYVGRVISAMINSSDDRGVVEGRWGGDYSAGYKPTHWTGSSAILTRWLERKFQPVKYGQCWVFAGVMCTVMRFLGIPCRVISNFNSAHDTNANLFVDMFRAEAGAFRMNTTDSIWNFHVWVEGFMKRPDLSAYGQYDGWQVLDPTPQELSGGVFRCGPASKVAIQKGHTHVEYDVPFVFAEVNADIIMWLTKVDYSMERLETDTVRVGQNISTKAEGREERVDVTDTYKPQEGTYSERLVFTRAIIKNFEALQKMRERERRERERRVMASSAAVSDERMNGEESREMLLSGEAESDEMPRIETLDRATEPRTLDSAATLPPPPERTAMPRLDAVDGYAEPRTEETAEVVLPPPRVVMKFEEVTQPINGKDVEQNLILSSESTADRPLVIVIEVHAMAYTGRLTNLIQRESKIETLQPGKPLLIPVRVPFSEYSKPMLDNDSMMISAMVMDEVNAHHPYLKERNVVLRDPPLHMKLLTKARLFQPTTVEVVFENPVNETLRNCTLTFSGSGLEKREFESRIQDIKPSTRIRMQLNIIPYKVGRKTLIADLDCSVFRDIKAKCIIDVEP